LDKINNRSFVEDGDIIMPMIGTIGNPIIVNKDREFAIKNVALIKFYSDTKIDKYYLKSILDSDFFRDRFNNYSKGSTQKFISLGFIRNLEIPLPPLEIQKEIVEEIEGYQKIIDGARQVVETYKPHIDIDPDWEMVELGETEVEIIDGDRGINYPKKEEFSADGYCVFMNTKNVLKDGLNFDEVSFITKEKDELLRSGKLKRNDVVMTTRGTVGNVGIYDDTISFENIRINSGMLIFRINSNQYVPFFLFWLFQSENVQSQIRKISSGSAQPQLPIRDLRHLQIPLVGTKVQKEIVANLQNEKVLVHSSRKLISIFEQKIKDRIAKVWGD
jgi:restriction endonuclease S subunit